MSKTLDFLNCRSKSPKATVLVNFLDYLNTPNSSSTSKSSRLWIPKVASLRFLGKTTLSTNLLLILSARPSACARSSQTVYICSHWQYIVNFLLGSALQFAFLVFHRVSFGVLINDIWTPMMGKTDICSLPGIAFVSNIAPESCQEKIDEEFDWDYAGEPNGRCLRSPRAIALMMMIRLKNSISVTFISLSYLSRLATSPNILNIK